MTIVLADLVTRAKISDPRPSRCSVCLTASDPSIRFVDAGAVVDRGNVRDPISGAVLEVLDDLHLCESCVREMAEVIDYKPGLHARHLQLNRQLMADNDRLETENRRLKQILADQ